MAGHKFRPTLDHAFRTPLTTILGLSEILKAEMFGPLGSERYRSYAADISACAAELQKFMVAARSGRLESGPAPISKTKRQSAFFRSDRPAVAPGETARRAKRPVPGGTAVSDAIGCIYDAATEADRWREVLECLRLLIDAECCALLSYDRQKDTLAITYMAKAEGDSRSAEDVLALNASVVTERILLAPGSAWTDDAIVPPNAQGPGGEALSGEKSAAGFGYRMTGVIERNDAEVTFISALRSRRRGPFGREEVALLEQLLVHARKAMNVQRRVNQAEHEREALAAGFGHLPLAVILVGSDGRPFYVNERARALFAAADGLVLKNEGLCGATVRETAALREATERAVAASARNSEHGGGALSLSRPSGHKPLSALVVPAPRKAVPGSAGKLGPAAAIFVADPEAGRRVNSETLRRFWRLTHNEARVASMIAMGYGVEQIAAEMRITANTVRTHLKHVYDKTETGGQVELVYLIMSSPAALEQD